LKAGALFSGIGGFCVGFERVGIETRWAVELDEYAARTYRHNVKTPRVIVGDVRAVTVPTSELEPVDVLHAGFPCQSFSQAGGRKGFEDPRGKLFYEIIRIVNEFKDKKPSLIVLENSPYIKHGDGGSWFIEIIKEIKKAGYWFREANCAELDTYTLTPSPQRRNRLFMVAVSIDRFDSGRFPFPEVHNSEPKQLSRYIDFDGEVDEAYYLRNDNRYHHLISSFAEDKKCIYQLRKYFVRVKNPNECPTLTANMGLGGHNVPFVHDSRGLRKLTEYECLRLQGFPDSFEFPADVPRARRYVQVGNSVSAQIAERLGKGILEKFDSERE